MKTRKGVSFSEDQHPSSFLYPERPIRRCKNTHRHDSCVKTSTCKAVQFTWEYASKRAGKHSQVVLDQISPPRSTLCQPHRFVTGHHQPSLSPTHFQNCTTLHPEQPSRSRSLDLAISPNRTEPVSFFPHRDLAPPQHFVSFFLAVAWSTSLGSAWREGRSFNSILLVSLRYTFGMEEPKKGSCL